MALSQRIKDYITDKYLTWRTGKDKSQRDWEEWYADNVNYRSTRIKDMFSRFKHIIIVDSNKFFQFDPFAWVPCEDAKQYLWPQRSLGDNAVWRFERVINCPATAWQWEINELSGEDKVFVATNNEQDAIMIALKFGG